ncbi:hypothetical protein TNCT_731741 [Trichonephila clavata]|uniref:Uncharacterized protein n=1 Tax=Trichonephila clavata TaxID=2740835 RepID=A0A8X6LC17_TRICU|nr:hypothetical protein TNCT_731741 [Trichonephila clavata]
MAFICPIPETISSLITDLVRRLLQLKRYEMSSREWPITSIFDTSCQSKKVFKNVSDHRCLILIITINEQKAWPRTHKTSLLIPSSTNLVIWQSASFG